MPDYTAWLRKEEEGRYLGPATSLVAANLDDANDLTNGPCRFLIISVAGALKVTMLDGQAVTIPTAPAGVLPIAVKRVWNTGTAATGIMAAY